MSVQQSVPNNHYTPEHKENPDYLSGRVLYRWQVSKAKLLESSIFESLTIFAKTTFKIATHLIIDIKSVLHRFQQKNFN